MKPWGARSSLQGDRQCFHTHIHLACLSETAGERKLLEECGLVGAFETPWKSSGC